MKAATSSFARRRGPSSPEARRARAAAERETYEVRLNAEVRRLAATSPCSYVQTEGAHAPNWCGSHDEPMAVNAEWCRGQVDRAGRNIRLADAGKPGWETPA